MKGVIYFQAIEEVYYDHLKNAHKVREQNVHVSSSIVRAKNQQINRFVKEHFLHV